MNSHIAVSDTMIDEQLVSEAHRLRGRASALRVQAGTLDDILSRSWRRRACELELEAWLLEVRAGVPLEELPHAA